MYRVGGGRTSAAVLLEFVSRGWLDAGNFAAGDVPDRSKGSIVVSCVECFPEFAQTFDQLEAGIGELSGLRFPVDVVVVQGKKVIARIRSDSCQTGAEDGGNL